MHWIDAIASELLDKSKEHVVNTGTSISGTIHIGSALELIMADAICRTIRERGGSTRFLWVMDDMDGLRKVPPPLPESFAEHLGKPVSSLPCPDGCCSSFVEHFTRPFVASLKEIGVEPDIISDTDLYRKGLFTDEVKTAMRKADEIMKIFKNVSGAEKEADWLPFQPVCANCGRIMTTKAYEMDGDWISYRCVGGIAGKRVLDGCGYDGVGDLRNGKLHWRVEWAAKWKILGVTCEPFGKDHATSGGSYDTCKVIVKDIFDYPPPHPVIYEHILLGGKKISKSVGNVITLDEFISVAGQDVARYFYFRTKQTRHKEFDMGNGILPLEEEYERTERIYHGEEEYKLDKELPDVRRAYELSRPEATAARMMTFFQVPYTHLVSIVQISRKWEDILNILARDNVKPSSDSETKRLKEKANNVMYWLDNYAPDTVKFSVMMDKPEFSLNEQQRHFLQELLQIFRTVSWDADALHKCIHDTADKVAFDRKQAFETLYQIIIGKNRGPRLGYFLALLGEEFVMGRVRDFAA